MGRAEVRVGRAEMGMSRAEMRVGEGGGGEVWRGFTGEGGLQPQGFFRNFLLLEKNVLRKTKKKNGTDHIR